MSRILTPSQHQLPRSGLRHAAERADRGGRLERHNARTFVGRSLSPPTERRPARARLPAGTRPCSRGERGLRQDGVSEHHGSDERQDALMDVRPVVAQDLTQPHKRRDGRDSEDDSQDRG